jgi:hypothetical protein
MTWKSIMPFPPREDVAEESKFLGNFSLRRFEFGFRRIEFGFLVFVKGKTHKIIFFLPTMVANKGVSDLGSNTPLLLFYVWQRPCS